MTMCKHCQGCGYIFKGTKAYPCKYCDTYYRNRIKLTIPENLHKLIDKPYKWQSERLRDFFKIYINKPKNKANNLLIHGETGTGKTHLQVLLAKERIKRGDRVLFLNAPEFFREIKDCIRLGEPIDYDFNRYDFIFIDDLGAEKITDFVKEELYIITNNILDTRFIITSNYTVEELNEKVGDRIISRLLTDCIIVKLQGKDKRIKIKGVVK